MILIDTNALVVFILGIINPKLISNHEKTSIYDEDDYYQLLEFIEKDLTKMVVLPNVWSELDNLLNRFNGAYREKYLEAIINTLRSTTEKFVSTHDVVSKYYFIELGITDSLLLSCAVDFNMILVTTDSKLSDQANSFGLAVYDMVKERQNRF